MSRPPSKAAISVHRAERSLSTVFDRRTLLVAICATLGCDASISSLDPATGHDRALVVANGFPIIDGIFLWDPGASEKWRAGGLAGKMFTVPGGSAVGPHSVQRYVAGVRGSPATFTVDELRTFPKPRIDRVSLLATEFRAAGSTVATLLYVQGANVDVGATVELKASSGAWTAISSMAHQGISNRGWDETLKIPYRGLDYPVYHHLAFVAIPGERPSGDQLTLRIQNEDGVLSDPFDYKLPQTESALDSDGDGMPDNMELTPSTRFRPDIFLEIDRMEDAAKPVRHPYLPEIGVALRESFAAAPIINPIGPSGINVVIDDSQVIPRNVHVRYDGPEDPNIGESLCTAANIPNADVSLLTLKRACFNNSVRGKYWHYCVWSAFTYVLDEAASKKYIGGIAELLGDDCVIGADLFTDAWMADVRTGAEILMHELGHNLGLRHGGSDDASFNPTYNSIMSYSWLGRSHWANPGNRKGRPVCTTLHYQLTGAYESLGVVPAGANPDQVRGYSDGMGRILRESDLDESEETPGNPYGVCNSPIDWSCKYVDAEWVCDDDVTDLNVVRDLNDSGGTADLLSDHPDWSRIVFNGPSVNGILRLLSDP